MLGDSTNATQGIILRTKKKSVTRKSGNGDPLGVALAGANCGRKGLREFGAALAKSGSWRRASKLSARKGDSGLSNLAGENHSALASPVQP